MTASNIERFDVLTGRVLAVLWLNDSGHPDTALNFAQP